MTEPAAPTGSISPVRKTGSGWLFGMGCGLGVLLAAMVVSAPFLDGNDPAPAGWRRIVALFARDITLRRTSLAGAAGLIATACVFFQPAPSRSTSCSTGCSRGGSPST